MCELSQELLNCGPNPDLVNTCGADVFQYVSDVAQCFCTLRSKSLVKFNCEGLTVKERVCKSQYVTAAAERGGWLVEQSEYLLGPGLCGLSGSIPFFFFPLTVLYYAKQAKLILGPNLWGQTKLHLVL